MYHNNLRDKIVSQETIRWFGHSEVRILVASSRVSTLLIHVPPGYTARRHTHSREDELFLIIDGSIQVELGGVSHLAKTGESMLLPSGVPHAYESGADGAMILNTCTPGGVEDFFREASVLVDGDSGLRALAAIGKKYEIFYD